MPNLVGIGLSQVPTNSMLGGLAYQSPDHASIKDLDLKNLSQINSEIADTAVDVFVYDTRKDSDGGAWRHRTQHTSWYNETLNTATRGSRKEFPSVAVIVADSSYTIKIYDGDDPDLPLWMEFQYVSSGSGLIPSPSAKPESIAAINGIIVFGNVAGTVNSGQAGVLKLDFIGDAAYRYMESGSSSYSGKWVGGGLANRNTGTPTIGSWDNTLGFIVDNDVNDVAMTVLPNAPIDETTGLPIPTIAVGTDEGVSIIKDDGTVVDHIDSAGGTSTQVAFTQDGKLAHSHDGHTGIRIDSLKSSDFNYGTNKVARYNSEEFYINYGLISSGWSGNAPKLNTGSFNSGGQIVPVQDNILAERANTGLNLLARDFPGSPNNNRVAYATTSYNTGWMHGDIKGAFLSDTDATNVTGSELVTNGDFASNSDWTAKGDTGLSISGGQATITLTTTNGQIHQNLPTLSAGTYVLSVERVGGTETNLYATLQDATSGSTRYNLILESNISNGTYSATVTIPSTENNLRVAIYGYFWGGTHNGYTLIIDNVSLRLAEPDRSVNNNGLQVFGTITKSAVATGAELVAYSGWSTSNYLEQPYNSDFNLTSTQDASWIIWFKNTESVETYYHFFDSGYLLDSSQHYWLIGLLGSGDGRPTFRLNGATQQNLNGVGNYLDGSWHQVIVTRTGNGTLISMYIDGKLSSTLSTSALEITHSTNAKLRIGLRGETNNRPNTGGYLTQFRFSKSAPSDEQIKKIYEDEKFLFQENAACTLYGSSDAVTALAYDDSTNILYAGTSSGRSDFQGLRRINNTTTAVTTAMSASNGLVAEQ